MKSTRKYLSKIMLVGEYGVILGGEALTIPFPRFYGVIRTHDASALVGKSVREDIPAGREGEREASGRYLRALHEYLSGIAPSAFHAKPDLRLFSENLDRYWMEMHIPVSYGLGSSGVVSAAVYEHFFPGADRLGLFEQKEDLAQIESFFHGRSSGVDALSCYTGRPLHFRSGGEIRVLDFDPGRLPGDHVFFLLDSGPGSNTGSLVSRFMQSMKDPDYEGAIREEYLPLNHKLIESLMGRSEADPAMLMGILSEFQYRHFRQMIPEKVMDLWIGGLVSQEYFLKLNGSGGGFLLGITPAVNREILEERWKADLIWID